MIRRLALAFGAFLLTLCPPAASAQDAVLRSGDIFEVRISGVPSEEAVLFNATYSIDGSGMLNLPHIGNIQVAGRTPGQAKGVIEAAYRSRDIYTNPTINIVVAPQARQVSVGGAVKAPQRVAFTADLTALAAINAAGGFNEFANQSKVRILRGRNVIPLNAKEVRRDPSRDVRLQPGDIIEVPESFF